MPNTIAAGPVHHIRMTVTDVDRSRDFYTQVLGFEVLMDLQPGYFLSNGSVGLGLGPSPDPARRTDSDRFDENRVGLDHLSFGVESRAQLDEAVRILDEQNVSHGDITDLGSAFGLYILAFRDPDNIQLELSAPHG